MGSANKIIIGLVGSFGSGCTTTSIFLEKVKKFHRFCLSDSIKKLAKQRIPGFNKMDVEERRKTLQDIGDELRLKDLAALARPVIEEIKKIKTGDIVIDSIRNPAEIEAFQKAFDNFYVFGIDAEADIRWSRLKHIYKHKAKFDRDDERDTGEDQPKYGQRVKECIEMADILLNNEESFNKKGKQDFKAIDSYAQKVSDYLGLVASEGKSRQVNFDELFMHYACSIAVRSQCSKRKVGAIIVHERSLTRPIRNPKRNKIEFKEFKENYPIAAGCNNVPLGASPCKIDEKDKCYRDFIKKDFYKNFVFCRNCGKKLTAASLVCSGCKFNNGELPGKLLDLCRAVHAEEAAILQAAKLGGISLEGAKLYSSAFPCMLCCKKIIGAGIKSVVYLDPYPMEGSLALKMFRDCGIGVRKFEGVTSAAFYKIFQKNLL